MLFPGLGCVAEMSCKEIKNKFGVRIAESCRGNEEVGAFHIYNANYGLLNTTRLIK